MTEDNGGGLARTQKVALVTLGVIVGIAVLGVSSAMLGLTTLDDPWTIGSGGTLDQDGGPTVDLGENVSPDVQEPLPADQNAVNLSPAIVFESDGDTHARLDTVGYGEDEWTELSNLDVTGADLEVDPAGAQRVAVGGDAETLRIRQVSSATVDDGRTDLAYSGTSGGTTTIAIHDQPTEERLEAIDVDTGEMLDIAQADASGTVAFDLPNSEHRVDIQSNSNPPEISNMSPPDEETVTDSATLSADVNYSDFDEGYNVTAKIIADGEELHTETLSENGTISTEWTNIEGGRNTWTVEVTDEFDTTTRESQTLYASVLLYIHDGSTSGLDLMTQDVEAELISTDQSSNFRETRTISDGTVRLGDVPDEQLYVELNSSGYDPRTLIITEPYGEQQRRTILFDSSNDDAFEQCYTLSSSASGFSPDSSWLIVQMHIEGEWRDAAGGYFGSDNSVCLGLEDSENYRLVIERDGDRRSLGGYQGDISFSDEIVPLLVEGVELSLDRGSTYAWEVQTEPEHNETDDLVGGDIVFKFDSGERTVEDLEITISNRSDPDHELQYDIVDGEIGTYVASYEVPEDHLNTTWTVEWSATIDGEEQTGSESVSLAYGNGDLGLGQMWTKIAIAGLLMLMAGIFGLVHAPAGAVVVASTAALFNLIGMIDLPTLLMSTTLAVAILGFVASKTRGGL